jgi:hypothetical protein
VKRQTQGLDASLDAAVDASVPDGTRMRSSDAGMDAFVCPPACNSGCGDGGTCLIKVANQTGAPVNYPPDLACRVHCLGQQVCGTTINCASGQSCKVTCEGNKRAQGTRSTRATRVRFAWTAWAEAGAVVEAAARSAARRRHARFTAPPIVVARAETAFGVSPAPEWSGLWLLHLPGARFDTRPGIRAERNIAVLETFGQCRLERRATDACFDF